MQHEQLKAFVIDKIDDMKGRDIVELDVKGKSTITDRRHPDGLADLFVPAAAPATSAPPP